MYKQAAAPGPGPAKQAAAREPLGVQRHAVLAIHLASSHWPWCTKRCFTASAIARLEDVICGW